MSQNNGHHSTQSTPQSQTPTTLHGPPTPTGHQAPTPQPTVMYAGQSLPPHSMAGGFNGQSMVLMGAAGHQQSMPGGQAGHPLGPVIPVLPSSAASLVMQQHYPQTQPPPPGR